ncbi:MAG: Rdx family protein [Actinomycetota bacterium]
MSATKDSLSKYQHVIEDLRVVTGSKGVFDVRVDGELIFSKHAEGRHAEPGEVLARFRDRLGPGVREYET